jgi:hypothetical protein
MGSLSISSIQPFLGFSTLTSPNVNLAVNDYIRAHQYISVSAALYACGQEAILTSLNAAICFDLISVKNEDGTIPDSSIVMPTTDNHNAVGGFL